MITGPKPGFRTVELGTRTDEGSHGLGRAYGKLRAFRCGIPRRGKAHAGLLASDADVSPHAGTGSRARWRAAQLKGWASIRFFFFSSFWDFSALDAQPQPI
jgi:hypothetical protein